MVVHYRIPTVLGGGAPACRPGAFVPASSTIAVSHVDCPDCLTAYADAGGWWSELRDYNETHLRRYARRAGRL